MAEASPQHITETPRDRYLVSRTRRGMQCRCADPGPMGYLQIIDSGSAAHHAGRNDVPAHPGNGISFCIPVSWPGIAVRRTVSLPLASARPSTSWRRRKTWMPGTSPGMTLEKS